MPSFINQREVFGRTCGLFSGVGRTYDSYRVLIFITRGYLGACFQVFGTLDPFGSCLAVTQLEVSGAFVEDGVGGMMMSCGWWLLKIGPKIGSKPALN
jgi:hypothetical protein